MRRTGISKDLLSSLGSVVKQRRLELGFSQEELAERAGLHRTYITDIERGARNITLKSVTRLAEALEVPLARMFDRVEGEHESGASEDGGSTGILLVGGNPRDVEFTKNALQKNGVSNEVIVAKTGQEALKLLFEQSRSTPALPSVVLLDLQLPDMNGLDILKKMRSDVRTKSIPVVVLTTSHSDKDNRNIMKNGAQAYITKPVYFSEFSTVMPKLGFRWKLIKDT